jgi:hypothetical protein
MYPQIIDDPLTLNTDPIATNSLPIWLSLTQVMPIYPSFLVPTNLHPPYATVHIAETDGIQSAPYIDNTSTHWQLVKDKVKVTIYGKRNNDALDFQDYIFQQSLNSENFGIQNIPIIKDEQRIQSELGILAIKKVIEFDINYYQSRALDIARQLILSATCSVSV